MCVCGLSDGRVLIKALKRSPNTGLWNLPLRNRATGMPTFRRQHPIGPYVLDERARR